ncbi:hypothetical protein EBB07_26170 [Paenibacillaceae bacterium]|nr:hypothetical protein EBB07_26170 [Paenibacillaceae bacterium]
MNAQLLICDRIMFLPEEKYHVLEKVLNVIDIPVLPYAVNVSVYAKLFDISPNEPMEQFIVITDSRGVMTGNSKPQVVRNMRASDQVPGVDSSFDLTFVVSRTGIHDLTLYVNGAEQAKYPLTVRMLQQELRLTGGA